MRKFGPTKNLSIVGIPLLKPFFANVCRDHTEHTQPASTNGLRKVPSLIASKLKEYLRQSTKCSLSKNTIAFSTFEKFCYSYIITKEILRSNTFPNCTVLQSLQTLALKELQVASHYLFHTDYLREADFQGPEQFRFLLTCKFYIR